MTTAPHFDQDSFMDKLRRFAGRLPFVKDALVAYYVMNDPNTPIWAKVVIGSALAYFVSPLDGVPDTLAVIGFLDDASVIAGVVKMVDAYTTDEHRARAREFFA